MSRAPSLSLPLLEIRPRTPGGFLTGPACSDFDSEKKFLRLHWSISTIYVEKGAEVFFRLREIRVSLSYAGVFPQPFFTEGHRWMRGEIFSSRLWCGGIKKNANIKNQRAKLQIKIQRFLNILHFNFWSCHQCPLWLN